MKITRYNNDLQPAEDGELAVCSYKELQKMVDKYEKLRDNSLSVRSMADCMAMVSDDLKLAGVVDMQTPPMMLADSVMNTIQDLREQNAKLSKKLRTIERVKSPPFMRGKYRKMFQSHIENCVVKDEK